MDAIQAILSAVVVPDYKPSSKVLVCVVLHVNLAFHGFLLWCYYSISVIGCLMLLILVGSYLALASFII